MEIHALGIVKEFGSAAALRGVDLHVGAGELMALLGPSGSGKTTLLRVIAGLEVPDRGQVLFGGEDATDLPVQRRGVGFVFQHYALFKHLTVFENVAYGLRARARPPAEAALAKRVLELLDLVQLGGLDRRFPAQLSGGQRQRVALARALAVEPRVLLLDEPFGALDAKVRKDLRRWLRDIHDRTGQTTVFVTHDQDEALELADRVAILSGGRIEQVGTPDEVHDEPASAFVMSFVGETARLPVRVAAGKAWLGDRPLAAAADHVRGAEADLFLRPWDLVPAEENADLVGVVRLVRRVGAGRRVELDLPSGEAVQVELPVATPVSPGERLGLAVVGGRIFGRGDPG